MASLLFVYGTLKRGCCNHHLLADQSYVGPAQTRTGFTLYDLGGYPGIVAAPEAAGVVGEVWSVDARGLSTLDVFEGVPAGLYRRESIPLQAPYDRQQVDAYLYARDVSDRPVIGAEWTEPRQ